MKGNTAVLVSSSSATHGRPWETDTRYSQAVNRNHSDLVKYSRQDQDYNIVLEHLRESSRSAERVIRFRFPELVSGRESQSASPKETLNQEGPKLVRQLLSARYIHKMSLLKLLREKFGSSGWTITVCRPSLKSSDQDRTNVIRKKMIYMK
jgi:hypothetical protein